MQYKKLGIKKNILIFPCGSEIALEINKALAHSTHFTIYGANSGNDHGRYVFKNYIDGVPYVHEANFLDVINDLIDKHNIDFIIPTHDEVIMKLAEDFSKVNAEIVTSDIETCRICLSKKQTYEILKDTIPTPKIYKSDEEIEFPAFLKPDFGYGSKGAEKVKNREEYDYFCFKQKNLMQHVSEYYYDKKNEILCLEFLPGKEYTVDCFTNSKGQLLFAKGRERKRVKMGISVDSKHVNNPIFKELAKKINQKLSFRGAWFFQVKESKNKELVLLEVAARGGGTMGLSRNLGINFMLLSLYDRMGMEVGVIENNFEIEVDRALMSRYKINIEYNTVYIDFDDTILIKDIVNAEMMRFVYQEKNKGKKIILITKHEKDIYQTLEEFAISKILFDEIICLKKGHHKHEYMKEQKAIFIDDSFAERKEVFDKLNIPVFGIDAVESLLDWRV